MGKNVKNMNHKTGKTANLRTFYSTINQAISCTCIIHLIIIQHGSKTININHKLLQYFFLMRQYPFPLSSSPYLRLFVINQHWFACTIRDLWLLYSASIYQPSGSRRRRNARQAKIVSPESKHGGDVFTLRFISGTESQTQSHQPGIT